MLACLGLGSKIRIRQIHCGGKFAYTSFRPSREYIWRGYFPRITPATCFLERERESVCVCVCVDTEKESCVHTEKESESFDFQRPVNHTDTLQDTRERETERFKQVTTVRCAATLCMLCGSIHRMSSPASLDPPRENAHGMHTFPANLP